MMTENMMRNELNEMELENVNGGAVKVRKAEGKYYTVQHGDTLTRIAHSFHTTVDRLVKWNNIKNPSLIFTGQKLRIAA